MSGRLIVIEGVDGSGKQTQTKLLCSRLGAEGLLPIQLNFPDYQSPSSALVKMYLAGEFGKSASDVPAKVASCFYALDRYASYKTKWQKDYEQGGLIVSDRYTTSNMVHQASKIKDPKEKEEFLDWLLDFEYNILSLPQPDLVIFLDMPPEFARELTRGRENKATGTSEKDIHEHSQQHLIDSYQSAKYAAAKYGWQTVCCVREGVILSVEEISDAIYKTVSEKIL